MARRTSNIQVNILGDSKDLQRAFSQAQSASRSFGDKVKGDLGKLWGWAKTGAAVLTGIGATIAGLVLKGGLNRALGIEDAQAKLRGLGHDADSVAKIMDNALAAVKGTAFGLDEAATIAASAVASGIKPGQELERTLKLVADAATIAGAPLNEMGAIFNKIQANGRMMTEEMNQLQDRGLPILQWLQEEYGVTAEAMREMVTQGQVDAETFRKVIEDNISGAALESGETTRGAFANVGAALSRLGATIVEKFLPIAKDLFGGLIEGVDQLTSKVGPAMNAFAESPFFQKLQEHAQRIPEYMESAVEGIINFWNSTESLRTAIGNIVAGAVDIVKWAIDLNRNLGGIPAVIGGIAAALRGVWTHPALAAVGGIAWLIGEIGRAAREVETDAENLFQTIQREGTGALAAYRQEAAIAIAANERFREAMDEFGITVYDVEQALAGNEEALTKIKDAHGEARRGTLESRIVMDALWREIQHHNNVTETATELVELHKEAEAERARAAGISTGAVEGADRALLTHIDITEDATDATNDHTDATDGNTDATDDNTAAVDRNIERKRALNEMESDRVGSLQDLTRKTNDLNEAERAVNEAEEQYGRNSSEYREAVMERAAAQNALDEAVIAAYESGVLTEAQIRNIGVAAGLTGQELEDFVNGYIEDLGRIPSRIPVKIDLIAPVGTYERHKNNIGFRQTGTVKLSAAQGAIATGPTDALIGEGGSPEAVIPLNRQGMEFMVKALRQVVAPMAPMGAASSGGGQPVYITINALDPQAAARAVVEALQTYNRNNGAIPIEIRSA